MIKFLGTSAIAFAAMLLVNIETVEAQGYIGSGCATCQGGGIFGGNFGLLGSPYALSRIPVPPYFSLHPPVYYSAPVARTYGYSPFAYPGYVRTPEVPVAKPAPKAIKNMHAVPVEKSTKKKTLLNLTMKVDDGVVENPFVNKTNTKLVRLSN